METNRISEASSGNMPTTSVRRATSRWGMPADDQHGLLGALIRPIFQADGGGQARERLGDTVRQLESRLPKVAVLLDEADEDVLAFTALREHWSKLRTTNPLAWTVGSFVSPRDSYREGCARP